MLIASGVQAVFACLAGYVAYALGLDGTSPDIRAALTVAAVAVVAPLFGTAVYACFGGALPNAWIRGRPLVALALGCVGLVAGLLPTLLVAGMAAGALYGLFGGLFGPEPIDQPLRLGVTLVVSLVYTVATVAAHGIAFGRGWSWMRALWPRAPARIAVSCVVGTFVVIIVGIIAVDQGYFRFD